MLSISTLELLRIAVKSWGSNMIRNADRIAQNGWCSQAAGGFGTVGHKFGRPDTDG